MGNRQSSPRPMNRPLLVESMVTSLNEASDRQQELAPMHQAPAQSTARTAMQALREGVANSCIVIASSITTIEAARQFAMNGRDVARLLLDGTLNGQDLRTETNRLVREASTTYTALKSYKDDLCGLRSTLNELHVESKKTVTLLYNASRTSFFRSLWESREERENRESDKRDYDLVRSGDQAVETLRKFLDCVVNWLNDAESDVKYIENSLKHYRRGDNIRANGMATKFATLCDELPQYQTAVQEYRDKSLQLH
ncbi:hypothetical protein FRC19_011283 [Serendipita sp. 401]|nr:hypothetical protein FRC15_003702 [Serendipita sp. 397]KAG8817548.1 hypothetical protein FRC19_011283 [Serendipita sp. 401]KAG9052302.1 hypothetical protein FS842_010168 [Serendipita sp. 407]